MITILQRLIARMRENGIELTDGQRDFIEELPDKDYSGGQGHRRAMDQMLAKAMVLTAIRTQEGKCPHEQG